MLFLGEGTVDGQPLRLGFLIRLAGDARVEVPAELYCLWFGEAPVNVPSVEHIQ